MIPRYFGCGYFEGKLDICYGRCFSFVFTVQEAVCFVVDDLDVCVCLA